MKGKDAQDLSIPLVPGFDQEGRVGAPHKNSAFWLFASQFDALMMKNAELFYRRPKLTGCIVTLPSIAILLLYMVIQLTLGQGTPPIISQPLLPSPCTVFDFDNGVMENQTCVAVGYAPNAEPYAAVMKDFAAHAGWQEGVQVVGFADDRAMATAMFHNRNFGYLDAGIVFDQPSVDGAFGYSMWLNLTSPYYLVRGQSFHYAGLQAAIEASVLRQVAKVPSAKIEAFIAPFADLSSGTPADISSSQVPSTVGAQIAGGVVILFFQLIVLMCQIFLIAAEKKLGLVGQMRMMGLSEAAYWMSWFAAFLLLSVLASLLFAVVAHATTLGMFAYCDTSVLFVVYLCFSVCCSAFAVMAGSFLCQPRWVTFFSFLVVAASVISAVIFEILSINREPSLADSYYSPDTSLFLQFMLFTQPWFHLIKQYWDIVAKTSGGGGGGGGGETNLYTWADLYVRPGPYGSGAGQYYAPCVAASLGNECILSCAMLLMAWYLAQVFGGEFSRSCYFFLTPSYWGKSSLPPDLFSGDTIAEVRQASLDNSDVRLHKLSKSYKSTTALKEVSFTMKRSEIFCLLGQNGAGKTTAIKCLTGYHNANHGQAFVLGLSIKHEMNLIQPLMGVCPQHDVLFPQLSGKAHLAFWARFKGLPRNAIAAQVKATLCDVSLQASALAPASTYSGGMKRRLSVGISSMGNPRILFLDEPTTGLDPLSRRRIWDMVRRLKRNRIICLTTHSMEEADALGDQIAILASGRLRALGTPLFLKHRFGKGYQISVMAHSEQQVEELRDFIKSLLPGAEVLKGASSFLTVAVPKQMVSFIPNFFRAVEDRASSLVREWGISNTTLEEVFLRLAASNKGVNTTLEMDGGGEGGEDRSGEGGEGLADTSQMGFLVEPLEERIEFRDEQGEAHFQRVALLDGNRQNLLPSTPLYVLHRSELPAAPHDQDDNKMEMATENEGEAKTKRQERPGVSSSATVLESQETHSNGAQQQQALQLEAQQHRHVSKEEPVGVAGLYPITRGRQLRALLLKSLSLQRVQKRTNCCFVTFLGLLVVLSLLLGLLVPDGPSSSALGGASECTPSSPDNCVCPGTSLQFDYIEGVDSYTLCNESGYVDYVTSQTRQCRLYDDDTCVARKDEGLGACSVESAFGNFDCSSTESDLPVWVSAARDMCSGGDVTQSRSIWVSWADGAQAAARLNLTGLGGLATTNWTLFGNDPSAVLAELQVRHVGDSEMENVNEVVKRSQREVLAKLTPVSEHGCTDDYSYFCTEAVRAYFANSSEAALAEFRRLFPDIGLHVTEANVDDKTIAYKLYVFASNDQDVDYPYPLASIAYSVTSGGGYNYCSQIGPDREAFAGQGSMSDLPWRQQATASANLAAVITGLSNALLRSGEPTDTLSEIRARIAPQPSFTFSIPPFTTPIGILLSMWSLPLATVMLLPPSVQTVLAERQSKVLKMMEMQGLDSRVYWLSCFVFQMASYCFFTGLFVAFNLIAGVQAYTDADMVGLTAALLAWGVSISAFVFLLTAVLGKGSGTTIVSLVAIFSQTFLSSIMSQLYPNADFATVLNLVPNLAFIRALQLAFLDDKAQDAAHATRMWASIGCLLAIGVVLLGFGVFVHVYALKGTEEDEGSAGSCGRLCAKLLSCDCLRCCCRGGDEAAEALAADVAMDGEKTQDEDVLAEARMAQTLERQGRRGEAALLVAGLSKVYPSVRGRPPKRAVKNLCLTVRHNEVFGLLGPNGAGKTTTLHMLSGFTAASKGVMVVGGHEVGKETKLVQKVLGVCPQFDWVWEDLSVEDHLLLYVRLKGADKKSERALAHQVAEQVELDGDALHTLAKDLSGGMRRRLSLGIALCGDPRVVFLDEPTTGLDVDTRQSVWQMIMRAKKARSVILTTHSMEEADALCERIGIMADGELQCVGSQLHLKNRFGSGFNLSISVESGVETDSDRLASIDSFVADLITTPERSAATTAAAPAVRRPVLRSKTQVAGGRTLHYSLPREATSLSTVFARMETGAARLGIREWDIAMASLDDVFLRIATSAEERRVEA